MLRRDFFDKPLRYIAGSVVGGMLLGIYVSNVKSKPFVVRPPGALAEEKFLGKCIQCGLCVRDCPYDVIKLATAGMDVALGTPYLTVREGPCYMCEDIPCAKACPSGALDKDLKDIGNASMGLAVLVDRENCLALRGTTCQVCYGACPVMTKAITLKRHLNKSEGLLVFEPFVNSDYCTGCGCCEYACVLEEAAIKVFSIEKVKGELKAA